MCKVKVYYWQGIIVDDLIFAEYQNILEKLIGGDYQAADLDLKKLNGYRVYTARINHSDRLLFTTLEKDGKSYLVVIDVIKNHDYQKASYLNPQVLRAYLERQEDALKDLITQHDFTAMDAPLEMNGRDNQKSEMQFVPLEYYQGLYLELDAEQKIILNTQLPAIISGPPGSGKSCLAMAIITQAVLQTLDFAQPIIYVAESAPLREQMRLSWQQHPASVNRPPNSVLFLSYEELLRRQLPQYLEYAAVEDSFFNEWYLKFERKQQKMLNINTHPVANIYQELCILCAYDKNEYLKLGMRQSLITDIKHREWLFHVYQSYQHYLTQEKKIDFRLSQDTASPTFPLIVVDEAQDYTASMLTQLSKLAQGMQIAVCMDTLQSIKEIMPHRVRFKLALKQSGINLEEHTLADTYRCSKAVIAAANQWLLIKHALLGGTADKLEFSQIQSLTQMVGEITWYEEPSDAEWGMFHQTTQSNQVAIITAEEFRQETIKLFHTPLVFTPEEIKGLEYQEVILYQPLMQAVFKRANTLLKEKFPEGALCASAYRSRHHTLYDLGIAFNEIFSACTRAKKALSIVQKKYHALEFLIQKWQLVFQQECKDVVNKELPSYTPTNWQEEILKQRAVGNERVAEEIERQKMSTQPSKRTDLAKPKKKERRKNSVVPFAKEKFLLKNNKQLSIELLNRRDRAEILFAEENGTCLFLQMLDREACLTVFLEQMQALDYSRRMQFVDEFTGNFTERMIHGLPLLFYILTKNLSQYEFTDLYTLIKYLPKGSLLQPLIYQGYPIPLCVALASSARGRENLRRLKLLNAPLFNDIPIEVITRIYPGTGSFLAFMLHDEVATKPSYFMDNLDKKYFSGLSLNVLFTRMQSFDVQLNGRSLFSMIVERYPDLFGKISIWFEADKMRALALLKDSLFDESNKHAIFFALCASKYVFFFLNLLKNQLHDYQIAALFSATDSYGMSALHKLVMSLPAELILKYLTTHKSWLSHLSGDLLTRVVNKNRRQYTLLTDLCAMRSRLEILNMLMNSSTEIHELQLIHFTQEFHLHVDDYEDDEKFSAFYLLSKFIEDNDILQDLLNANSNLYFISPAVLFAIKPETSNFPDTSIFYYLTKSEQGQEILKKIIHFNDNLSENIQVEHFLEPQNDNISDMKWTIPFYWLAFHYESTGLLDYIVNLNQFIENTRFRAILYENLAKDRDKVINIARCLTKSERGINLLLNFLKNEQLVHLLLGHNAHDGVLRLDKEKHGDFFCPRNASSYLFAFRK